MDVRTKRRVIPFFLLAALLIGYVLYVKNVGVSPITDLPKVGVKEIENAESRGTNNNFCEQLLNRIVTTNVGKRSYGQLLKTTYETIGYKLNENQCSVSLRTTNFPPLKASDPSMCQSTFSAWRKTLKGKPKYKKPPKQPPKELKKLYTLNGLVKMTYKYYGNDANNREVSWKNSNYTELIRRKSFRSFTYGEDTAGLYNAMKETKGPKKAVVLVVGSLTPWVESIALWFGASKVVTVEYSKITNMPDRRMKYMSPAKLADNWKKFENSFDVIASFSSIEHSGLGRFNDPLDPYGDLKEMRKLHCLLKPNGIFYLAVPVKAVDALVFNPHRIYGLVRLPLLLSGFNVNSVYCGNRKVMSMKLFLEKPSGCGGQPVMVLQKTK